MEEVQVYRALSIGLQVPGSRWSPQEGLGVPETCVQGVAVEVGEEDCRPVS